MVHATDDLIALVKVECERASGPSSLDVICRNDVDLRMCHRATTFAKICMMHIAGGDMGFGPPTTCHCLPKHQLALPDIPPICPSQPRSGCRQNPLLDQSQSPPSMTLPFLAGQPQISAPCGTKQWGRSSMCLFHVYGQIYQSQPIKCAFPFLAPPKCASQLCQYSTTAG